MSVTGSRRNAAVRPRPAWRPPSPIAITGPRSGSLRAPTSRSAPAGTRGWTTAPIHPRPADRTRRSSSRQPACTAASPSRPSRKASMSPARAGAANSAFSAIGPPISAAAVAAWSASAQRCDRTTAMPCVSTSDSASAVASQWPRALGTTSSCPPRPSTDCPLATKAEGTKRRSRRFDTPAPERNRLSP